MRGLDESTDVFLRTGQKAQEQVRHAWDGFINFAARDNVLEVALGLIRHIFRIRHGSADCLSTAISEPKHGSEVCRPLQGSEFRPAVWV